MDNVNIVRHDRGIDAGRIRALINIFNNKLTNMHINFYTEKSKIQEKHDNKYKVQPEYQELKKELDDNYVEIRTLEKRQREIKEAMQKISSVPLDFNFDTLEEKVDKLNEKQKELANEFVEQAWLAKNIDELNDLYYTYTDKLAALQLEIEEFKKNECNPAISE